MSPTISRRELLVGSSGSAGMMLLRYDETARRFEHPLEAVPAHVSPTPAFLAVHPRNCVVYAISAGRAELRLLRRKPGDSALRLEGVYPTGPRPCHVALDESASSLLVSSYGDGSLTRFALDQRGLVRGSPSNVRGGVRTHCSVFAGHDLVISADLGADRVVFWRSSPSGLNFEQAVRLAPGSEPRHIALHPRGTVLVLTERTNTVVVLGRAGSGRWRILDECALDSGTSAPAFGAIVTVTPDGLTAHAGIRGTDQIMTLRLSPDGEHIAQVDETASGGLWPRHHTVVGSTMFVANEHSDSVEAFAMESDGRIATRPVASAPASRASCVVELRGPEA